VVETGGLAIWLKIQLFPLQPSDSGDSFVTVERFNLSEPPGFAFKPRQKQ